MSVLSALLFCLPALIFAQVNLHPYDVSAAYAFDQSDYNHDGVFDRSEMEHFFRDFDTNGDGSITFHEFTNVVNANHVHNSYFNHFLHALYAVYDFNNDHHVNHLDFDRFFALADSNSDNLLEKPEYVHYVSVLFASLESV